jgi:hypothetical protein
MECFDLASRQLSSDISIHPSYKAKESHTISSSVSYNISTFEIRTHCIYQLVDTILTLLELSSDPAEQNTLYAQATALSSSMSYTHREK